MTNWEKAIIRPRDPFYIVKVKDGTKEEEFVACFKTLTLAKKRANLERKKSKNKDYLITIKKGVLPIEG